MKITLVRHTEVDEAYHKCYNGHIDIGLSKKGEEDAKKLAKLFEKREFERVYCSDLKRARETLKPFIQAKNAIYTELLREKSWGKHEGKTFDAIIAEGEIEYKDFLQWIYALDGEDYELYVERIRHFFLEELLLKPYKSVLIVTHAGVIRTLIALVQKLSLEEAFSIDLPYSSYVVFDTEKIHFIIPQKVESLE